MKAVLECIKIHKFRNVKPGTELKFSDTFNVLIGKNATGKTTLLNLISSIIRDDYDYPNEEISLDYTFRSQFGALTGSIFSKPLREASEFDLDPSLSEFSPIYTKYRHYQNFKITNTKGDVLDLQFDEKKGQYKVNGEDLLGEDFLDVPSVAYSGRHRVIAFLTMSKCTPRPDDFLGITGPLTTFAGVSRFDEGLDSFRHLIAKDSDNHIAVVVSDNSTLMHFFGDGSSFFETDRGAVFMNKLKLNKNSTSFEVDSSYTTGLSKFAVQTGFSKASLYYDIVKREEHGEEEVRTIYHCGNPSFRFFKDEEGKEHTGPDFLSFGQKRLLAFTAYLTSNPTFVIADELVNGFHHDWITFCMKEMEGRQSFLASQNPLIFDCLGFDSPEELASSFVQCSLDAKEDEEESLLWEQMSLKQAKSFFSAYEKGFQQVSELLRTRGLW